MPNARLISIDEVEDFDFPAYRDTAKVKGIERCVSVSEATDSRHYCMLAPNHDGVHVCYDIAKRLPHVYWAREG